jgi:glycosyltransferase 2 family protein
MSHPEHIAAATPRADPPVRVDASTERSRWPDAGRRRTVLRWARPLGGAAILAVLVVRLGTGPFLDGVRRIDGTSLAAAAGIAVLTTVFSAWRWSLVARGLGVGVPLRAAVASYYRSQFLNATLPGGVLGDVHRGVLHGRDAGDVSLGLRAVAWERLAGQGVQLVLTLFVLLVLPSPVRSAVPVLAIAIVAGVIGAIFLSRAEPHSGSSRRARALRAAAADLRNGLYARRAWPGIVLASVVVVVGHVATFLIAARVAGSTASAARMVPLALLVLLAAAVPANLGGWGPREGVAAWAFGAAGLGASQGLAAAAVFGVMVFVSSLPGAVVLIAAWLHRGAPGPHRAGQRLLRPAAARPEGAQRG